MSYSFGMEEEYFLSDANSRGIVRHMPMPFIDAARAAYPGEVQREMLQSQIEVATPICETMDEARRSLSGLREGLSRIATEHGLAILAAGTHPTAVWTRQRATRAARYDRLMRDLQMLGHRNQVCGLHVHVALPDTASRVDVMVRALPMLPLILALSTSSPFWQAQRTGLMGYRMAAYSELPRTGLPEIFSSASDYDDYIAIMVESGAIADSSFVWWAIRPSRQHPTLELRIADSCTRLEDALAIAALFRCLVRRLDRDTTLNSGLTPASRAIVAENLWRAQRYGIHGGLICERRRTMIDVPQAIRELLAELADDAEALGCVNELAHCRTILEEGTSADTQLALYEEGIGRHGDRGKALASVVDWLTGETARGGAMAMAEVGHA
jgi:glutamate---cysteine ligase / carboxylate-amine ligase